MKYILFVFFLFEFGQAHGQPGETQRFFALQGTCRQTLIFDSTGLFFRTSACGDTALLSFGRYRTGKQNIIRFQPLPFDSITPVARMVTENIIMEFDSLLTVTFFDRYQKPLAFSSSVRVVDRQNRVYPLQTDERGEVEVNRFRFQKIYLEPLHFIFGETVKIDIARESLMVYLNLPGTFLHQTQTAMEPLQAFSLQRKKNSLFQQGAKAASYKLQ